MYKFKSFLNEPQLIKEYLTDKQRKKYSKYEMTPEARKATDHFFGDGNDHVREDLPEDDGEKSEVHKKVESHIGQTIDKQSYVKGMAKDKYGRDVRLGKIIKDDRLKNEFANDSTRSGMKKGSSHYVTVVRGTEVAGQTNSAPDAAHPKGHSWGDESCKNVDDGSNKKYLQHEVKHGSVVVRVHDHNNQEIYRATLQPHHNDVGHTAYAVDSEYGIQHNRFTKHAQDVASRLSGDHKGGSIVYKKHKSVYNDSGSTNFVHPKVKPEEFESVFSQKDKRIGHEADGDQGSIMSSLIDQNHPLITHHHLDLAMKNGKTEAKIAALLHPLASADMTLKALDDRDGHVRSTAASSKKLSGDHLDKAVNHKNEQVRAGSTRNPNLTNDQVEKLAKDSSAVVQSSLLSNRKAPHHVIAAALNSDSEYTQIVAANHPNITPALLDKAFKHSKENVRRSAFKNSAASQQQLEKAFEGEQKHDIRKTAMYNRNASAKILHKSFDDEVSVQRPNHQDLLKMASHPNADTKLLQKALPFAKKTFGPGFLNNIASHPNVDKDTRIEALKHVASHPLADDEDRAAATAELAKYGSDKPQAKPPSPVKPKEKPINPSNYIKFL